MYKLPEDIDYRNKQLLVYNEDLKPDGFYKILDIEHDIVDAIKLRTTLGTITGDSDQILVTTDGNKKIGDIRNGDRIKHPYGFEAVVLKSFYNRTKKELVSKFNLGVEGYIQLENFLVKV